MAKAAAEQKIIEEAEAKAAAIKREEDRKEAEALEKSEFERLKKKYSTPTAAKK
jgi:hypothetical protein